MHSEFVERERSSSMVGVTCFPEPKPSNALAGLSPSLASFMHQLPPFNGSAPDLDMLISILLQSAIPSGYIDSTTSLIPPASSVFPSSSSAIDYLSGSRKGTPILNVSNMRSSNAGQGCGYLMNSSFTQSNVADPTLKLHKVDDAHTNRISSFLASFIHDLPIVNGPSPNVDRIIFALLHGDVTFGFIHRSAFLYRPPSTSSQPDYSKKDLLAVTKIGHISNGQTMKSSQTSQPLKRKRDDNDEEEAIPKKPLMDIFRRRQIRKLQAMSANMSGTTFVDS